MCTVRARSGGHLALTLGSNSPEKLSQIEPSLTFIWANENPSFVNIYVMIFLGKSYQIYPLGPNLQKALFCFLVILDSSHTTLLSLEYKYSLQACKVRSITLY